MGGISFDRHLSAEVLVDVISPRATIAVFTGMLASPVEIHAIAGRNQSSRYLCFNSRVLHWIGTIFVWAMSLAFLHIDPCNQYSV